MRTRYNQPNQQVLSIDVRPVAQPISSIDKGFKTENWNNKRSQQLRYSVCVCVSLSLCWVNSMSVSPIFAFVSVPK